MVVVAVGRVHDGPVPDAGRAELERIRGRRRRQLHFVVVILRVPHVVI